MRHLHQLLHSADYNRRSCSNRSSPTFATRSDGCVRVPGSRWWRSRRSRSASASIPRCSPSSTRCCSSRCRWRRPTALSTSSPATPPARSRSAPRRILTTSTCRRRTRCSTGSSATVRCSRRSTSTTGRVWRWARSSPATTSSVFGVAAALGRTILPEDDVPSAPRVAMVSHRYWTRELGSAPDVVGRTHPHPRQSVHDRRRRAVRLQRHGAGAVAGDVDSGVRVARGRTGRDARHGAVADRHDPSRSPRRPVAVHPGPAEPGKTIDEARANLTLLMSRLEAANPSHEQGAPPDAEGDERRASSIPPPIRSSCRSRRG